METSLVQSLTLSQGSPLIFLTRPISLAFVILAALSVVSGMWVREKAKAGKVELEESEA